MAWYTVHRLRFRGRLVAVESRYGCYNGARVLKGKPLDLSDGSRNERRLAQLFDRSPRIKSEIESVVRAMDEDSGR